MLNLRWPVFVMFVVSLVGGAMGEAVSAEAHHAASLVAAGSPRQFAPNSVQALSFSVLTGDKIAIKLVFKHELRGPPAVFASYHPTARIVLDFADTISELGKDLVEVGQRGLHSLRVIQAGTRTRLVISLVSPLVFETALKGKELLVTLQRPETATSGGDGRPFPGATSGAPARGVREVAFQRGKDGVGRIIVSLSHASTPIDVQRQGNTLIVDFLGSALSPYLDRRLDVQDFGTPVRAIETCRLGNNVRLKIELEAAGEYSAYQISREFIVSL